MHRVHGHEPAGEHVVVAGPQIVEAEIRVQPFAAVKEIARRSACRGNLHAEGVERLGIAHRACRVRQEAYVAVTVIAVKAWRPRTTYQLVLADSLSRSRLRASDALMWNALVPG